MRHGVHVRCQRSCEDRFVEGRLVVDGVAEGERQRERRYEQVHHHGREVVGLGCHVGLGEDRFAYLGSAHLRHAVG